MLLPAAPGYRGPPSVNSRSSTLSTAFTRAASAELADDRHREKNPMIQHHLRTTARIMGTHTIYAVHRVHRLVATGCCWQATPLESVDTNPCVLRTFNVTEIQCSRIIMSKGVDHNIFGGAPLRDFAILGHFTGEMVAMHAFFQQRIGQAERTPDLIYQELTQSAPDHRRQQRSHF